MKRKLHSILILSGALQFFICVNAFAQAQLNVLNRWGAHANSSDALYNHFLRESSVFFQQREEAIARIETLDQWKERQAFVSQKLLDLAGPFPERTPLNPQITRTIKKKTFRVEHIVYESRPGLKVTSSLFIPAGVSNRKKAPAIIYCSGHSASAYRSRTYLSVVLNLVNKGFVVFALDPVGQGERLEYLDPATGKSIVGAPTREHAFPGAQLFLTGNSLASFMIWDGIRAVDYLLTRPEVDPARLGITGGSGGGTQSAYIAAYDSRIYAAAPERYITSFPRLLQSIGPQDAEQDIFSFISEGLDHADFLAVRAPKPALMITTTNDFFNISGAKDTEAEVKRIYEAYGVAENFGRAEDLAPHATTRRNSEAMYAFFQKHLNNPGRSAADSLELLTPEELRVTETGQLLSSPTPGETTFSLNRKYAAGLARERASNRNDIGKYISNAVAAARSISGYKEPTPVETPVITGVLERDGYSIEKTFISGEGDYVVPYLKFIPPSPSKVLLYLHPNGKAGVVDEIERYVKEGYVVVAPDLIGQGEMGKGLFDRPAYFSHVQTDGLSYIAMNWGVLIGRSVPGIRAGDIVRLIRTIKREQPDAQVYAVAIRGMASTLLHAAAFEPGLSGLVLINPLTSYSSIAEERFYDPHFIEHAVPRALTRYDLPDLAASLAPTRLLLYNPTDAAGKLANVDTSGGDLSIVRSVYAAKQADEKLSIVFREGPSDTSEIIRWLGR